jgi:hypothetical protein
MPKISKRARVIKELKEIFASRVVIRQLCNFEDEEDLSADAVDIATAVSIENAKNMRCIFRGRR